MTPATPKRARSAPNLDAIQRAASSTRIGDLMHHDVVCVTPELDIEALMAVLLEHQIGGVPVVDHSGAPLGVVSKTDVVRACHDGQRGITVGEIMMPLAFALPADSSVARAAALMAIEGVHRVLVVDDGAVVGILSSLDVLGWLGETAGYLGGPG